jgi:hypothetical protein
MLPRLLKLAVFLPFAALIPATAALAVSDQVRQFCRDDYYAHCPNHAVGSNNLRRCMKTAGPKLSSGCIKALVASGEISQAEMRQIAKRLKSTN